MTEIQESGEMIATAARQGVEINGTEAMIILQTLDDGGYEVLVGKDFSLWLHEKEDADGAYDTEYRIDELIEVAKEVNEEALSDKVFSFEESSDEAVELMKNDYILGILLDKVKKVVPPKIRKYKVGIVEHRKRVVTVEAASWAEAELKARKMWDKKEIELDSQDFAGVMFTSG